MGMRQFFEEPENLCREFHELALKIRAIREIRGRKLAAPKF
jgi:hypothetical protein